MVRRVCRDLGGKKNIVVINDEAHHCYRRQARTAKTEKLTGEERAGGEEARRGSPGLDFRASRRCKSKIGVKAVYDLSATPFFLQGSGYPEGTLFPWVVSDFSLIDAIEVGHREGAARAGGRQLDDRRSADLPRPVAADSGGPAEEGPQDRRHRRRTEAAGRACRARCTACTGTTRSRSSGGQTNAEAQARGLTPPVFIVVCNNTNVSKMVFDYIAGWDEDAGRWHRRSSCPGKLALFSNEEDGRWSARPNTHPGGLASSSNRARAMSAEFKKIAAARDRGVQGRVPRALPRT